MIFGIEDYSRLVEQGALRLFELQQLHTRVPEGTRSPDLVGAEQNMGVLLRHRMIHIQDMAC